MTDVLGALSRRRLAQLLSASALVPLAGCATHASAEGDADFDAMSRACINAYLRLNPTAATQAGEHRYDGELPDLSAEGRAAGKRFATEWLATFATIDRDRLSADQRVDVAILENELRGQLWAHDVLQSWAWDPLIYQAAAGDALYGVMAREFAPLPQRLQSAIARMRLTPDLLRQTREALDVARVPKVHAETYARQNPGLISLVDELIAPHRGLLDADGQAAFDAAARDYRAAVEAHQHWIEQTLVPGAQGQERIGAELFDEKLRFTLNSPLTREEIKRDAEAAVTRVRAQMYEIAKAVMAGRPGAPALPDAPDPAQQQTAIRAALDLASADRAPRDKLVEASMTALGEATAFVRARDLITLPSDPVRVILMPEFQRGVAVAYCDPPGPLEQNLPTFYAVSPIPDDWSDEQANSFLKEYSLRGIADIAVHEAMPGHYVQLAHSRADKSLPRSLLYSGSFVEGWAVYAENMMAEEGFKGDDPLYRLVQLKVLLRTITNALLDQGVHVDGMSQEAAMRLMTETAFQEEREAAGKWVRARVSSTQLSTYFVGYTEHVSIRAEAERRWGAGFGLKRYHDAVLAHGSPPARYARALMFNEEIG